jgi:nucleotide-binding universal stress UspA family protein
MNQYKKIVVATDFSETSDRAYQFARHLATSFGSTIHVVNVYQPIVDTSFPEYVGYSQPLENFAKFSEERLVEFVRDKDPKQGGGTEVETPPSPKVTQESILGNPTDTLIELSKDPSVDLMILGSVGEHDWVDRIWGSVSVNIARDAFCPVLLVPKNGLFYGMQSILYAASSGSAAPSIVGQAIDWAKHFGSALHFVHVSDLEIDKSDVLFKIILAEKAPELHYTIENRFANEVKDGIYEYASEHGVDMIIAYTHHYSFVEELMMFSVSEDLAWHAKLPILFIHS